MRVRTQLKDIVSFSKGKQINGDELLVSGKYDYLNGGVLPSGKWNEYNTAGETVTISEGGNSCGFVNFMEKPFWCGAHCYYLFEPKINAKYLYYSLKSKQSNLMKIRSGACMPNIKKNDLGKFKIVYDTDSNEQFKTIKVLDTVSLMIVACQKQLQKLDELVKSRFIEMFGSISDDKKVSMSDVCLVITDGTHQPPKFTSSGIPFLFVSNIVGNEITYDAEKYISEETYAQLIKRTPIEIGDVLLSTVGSYGHPAVVKINKPFCFQRHIAYLKPKTQLIDSCYLHGAILSLDVQKQIEERVKGIAQKTLNLSEIRKLRLPLPAIVEQKQFAAFVEQVDKSKIAVQQALDKAQLLFDSLMQKYFE